VDKVTRVVPIRLEILFWVLFQEMDYLSLAKH